MDTTNTKTTVYLIRHGTTDWNRQLRYQGRADIPLDEAGERQGALLREYFRDISVDVGFSSPLRRARRTLEYALSSQRKTVPALTDPDLTEIDFGEADGMTKEEIRARFPDFYRLYVLNEDRAQAVPPGGEPMEHVYTRMRDAVLRIARKYQGQTVVIAGHGTAIQSFLNYASGIPAARQHRFLLYNVSVSCVEIDAAGQTQIRFIGDRHHIPEELAFCYGFAQDSGAVSSGTGMPAGRAL